uniref:Sporulation integral membrane protein YtvI n=1 Tax=Heterorhabditis bacteriophora TaxID=37862 RepID=A0A1I7XES7_HETBA
MGGYNVIGSYPRPGSGGEYDVQKVVESTRLSMPLIVLCLYFII